MAPYLVASDDVIHKVKPESSERLPELRILVMKKAYFRRNFEGLQNQCKILRKNHATAAESLTNALFSDSSHSLSEHLVEISKNPSITR